jgi:hypothetical protein
MCVEARECLAEVRVSAIGVRPYSTVRVAGAKLAHFAVPVGLLA